MIWLGITFVSISYTILFAVWIVYASPNPGVSWTDPSFFIKNRETTPIISVALSAVSAFTDLYVLSSPLIALSGLNLTTSRKLALSVLFATGLL